MERFLVVGLGNYPKEYGNTRHNAGFKFVDLITSKLGIEFGLEKKFKGELCKTELSGHEVFFLKPHTYMNLSGESVSLVLKFYKIDIKNMIVVYDDIDIDLGKIKFAVGTSTGGHNGLKSINQFVKNEYSKIRIGIGRPENSNFDVSDYVLYRFSSEEIDVLNSAFHKVYECIEVLFSKDKQRVLDLFSKINTIL